MSETATYIYAPYIPFGPKSPILNMKELKKRRFYPRIENIYSNINNRFKILDL